ncbi:MAG: substrate-binding domain-containing protein [Candidatus Onthovivens sp.]|nr:substrate-binding domain-containing protein [Candidatus Onthovivens sp.]
MKKKLMLLTSLALVGITLASCNSQDKKIICYTRDTTSGTRDGFFTGIGFSKAKEDNALLAEGFVEVASNSDMINAIKNDEYGIGYISLSSLADSKVKGLSYESVKPTEANVLNNTYGLTRNFNYCKRESYKNEVNGQIVDAFIGYMFTVEGKSTIAEHGGILESSSSDPSWNDIKSTYPVAALDNSSVVLSVGGSTSVKSIVSALLVEFSTKCGNFKYNYAPTGSGDAYKRTNGSEKDGANYCDLAFASREFNSDETMDASLRGKMCIDAIIPVVNNSNSLENVTKETLKAIYDGTIKYWKDVK